MAERKGFYLYLDQYVPIRDMTLEQKGALLDAIFVFNLGQEPEISDPFVRMAFGFFRVTFERDMQKYSDVCEKRRAASNTRWNANDANACKSMQMHANDANACKSMQMHANDANAAKATKEKEQEKEKIQDTPVGVSVPASGGDTETGTPDGGETDKPENGGKPAPDGLPPCPHGEIVALYHELLPELPRVKVWDGARKTHLQARWRDCLTRHHIRDRPGGLEYWRRYFGYVRTCPLLMGQVTGRDGRVWRADLAWLVKAENFAKVIEGRYRQEDAQ